MIIFQFHAKITKCCSTRTRERCNLSHVLVARLCNFPKWTVSERASPRPPPPLTPLNWCPRYFSGLWCAVMRSMGHVLYQDRCIRTLQRKSHQNRKTIVAHVQSFSGSNLFPSSVKPERCLSWEFLHWSVPALSSDLLSPYFLSLPSLLVLATWGPLNAVLHQAVVCS